ncbi:MAG: RNA polymerase sigma factor [Opitutaceae bacterium]|nr:RNA polymerase sigma factor [Opitutaceae bacterium]
MNKSEKKLGLIEEWYRRYGHELYCTLCLAVKNSDLAQEISQEAFLKMAIKLTGAPEGTVIEYPKAFLYKIAYNEIYTRHKRRKLERHLFEVFSDSEYEFQNDITPEDIVLDKEELAIIMRTIDQLPRKQKQAFLLSRSGNLTHAEIANDLGIKKGSVKQHIVRVLSRLRDVRKSIMR